MPGSVDGRSEDETSSSFNAAMDRLCVGSGPAADFSLFSRGVGGTELPFVALLKSNAVPGVFGVLEEDPKDAKAPEPKPNAEDADAPAVGDAIPEVLRGAMALKGFRSELPKRLELEKSREPGWSLREESLLSFSMEERELLLFRHSIVSGRSTLSLVMRM